MDGKAAGGSSPSGGSMGVWDEALKNQSALRSGMGLKNSRSSPSLRYYTLTHPHQQVIQIYIEYAVIGVFCVKPFS